MFPENLLFVAFKNSYGIFGYSVYLNMNYGSACR